MQDYLSRYTIKFNYLYGNGSLLHNTQRLPVMGLAARIIWINQGIRRGKMLESQQLRERETVLEALDINCKGHANAVC